MKAIRQNIFILVKTGFNYENLVRMPLEEFYYYIDLKNEFDKSISNAADAPYTEEIQKSIGEIIPKGII